MPKPLVHALIWSHEHKHYTLYSHGQPEQDFLPEDQSAFARWLDEHAAFAFEGQAGSISVLKEARSRGSGYWYAYRTHHRRTRKRYLGRTQTLSLARLEETSRMLLPEQKPARSTSQGIALLSSKLSPPRLPDALVERERLLAALDEAIATRLALVCAPAGFGKTTLLAAWASRRKIQIAWLSLDDLDTTPTRFWVALIAALRRCPSFTPSFGASPMALLQSPQPPPLSTMLTALLQELENCEGHAAPIVVIVDDYQVIQEPAIHEGMSFFLEHLPAHVHLILSSRVDPDLPLARLRVRGHLTEIRADELRFAEGEASQYLGQLLSPALEADEVRRLVSRTEGWIAGLHLAALTLQKRADRTAYLEALTGSQRYLLDYVQEEILVRLPESVRDFLLKSALLSRLDAAACQAVTAAPTRAASQQMLVFLERANLFVVPLDEERHSYRLHELFREALLAVLHTTQPERAPLLHRRAAAFYEAEGDVHEAISHALQAADYSMAANLLEQTVEEFWLRGEIATMARWALILPEQTVREHAHLLLTTALYLLSTVTQTTQDRRTRSSQEARQLMTRVQTLLRLPGGEIDQEISATRAGALSHTEGREAQPGKDILLPQRLRLLQIHLVFWEAVAHGDDERMKSMEQEIEEELEREEEAIWQLVPLACSFLLHYTVRKEGANLVPRLLAAYERASRSESRHATYKVGQWLAMAALEAGQLHLAYEESLAALDLIGQTAGYVLLKGYFEVVLARVYYQWNRLEEARSLLDTVVHDASTWQHLDVLAEGYIEFVGVALARGAWSDAELALHELERWMQHERSAVFSGWLPIVRVQWWLAQGQLKEASDWVSGVLFPEGSWDRSLYDAFPIVIRVYFAQRRFREALNLLERWSEHLDRPANVRITMTYLAQLLVALHQAGQHEQVRVIAERLFALTEPEGYLRVYLDEGEPMKEALQALFIPHSQQHEWAVSTTASITKLLAAFEQEQSGASRSPEGATTSEPALSSARQPSVISSAPGISLTRREQEVLSLLAAGASNQDIAQALVISLDTVKKHVSNLFGKLGAGNRTQAVALARARSLL
ncbi:LuxR C-terminal-related transcriptional regulator [Ktedonobacter racemifer]|nr:LuxR C-terminal-related transcriptional regulator [Ktedonobacter racemifer]